jgi:hypothetical protein
VAVYIDTFLAAMLTTIAFNVASDRQRRIVGTIMVTICVLDVLLAVYEVRVGDHLLPQGELDTIEQATAAQYEEVSGDASEFRGFAFWTHPLTGALATAMAALMVLGMGMRWRRVVVLLAIFAIGLLAYGGRAALVTTILMLTSAALFQLAAGLATRRLNVGFLGAFIGSVFVLPALFILLVSTTGIGDRIMTHLYLDDSAQVRIVQWRVLGHLNLKEVLLGVPIDRVNSLKQQVGLTGIGADIENPWLLTFLGLGLVGFPVLVGSLFLFLWHLGQRANRPVGWLIIMATLLICSTSNSLGRKAPDLIIMTGFLFGVAGFQKLGEVDEAEARSTAIAPHVPTEVPMSIGMANPNCHVVFRPFHVAPSRWLPQVVYAGCPIDLETAPARLEPARGLHKGFPFPFMSMRRMNPRRRKAGALWLRFSQSLASRRHHARGNRLIRLALRQE